MKKINWKVRFKNKVFLLSFFSLIIGFAYNMFDLLDIVPAVTQSLILDMVSQFLTFLGLLGVIVDPTTDGFEDSDRAMTYAKPWNDAIDGTANEDQENDKEIEEDPEEVDDPND
jgi:phi LC3 family holin